MCQSGPGTGTLVPTGKREPALGVKFEISHYDAEAKGTNGLGVHQKRAAIQFLAAETGQTIPPGDFDLLIENELIRLKHTAGKPEWLVLSSYA